MKKNQLVGSLNQIKCLKHNQIVMQFSLEEEIELEDRLLCKKCLGDIDVKFKSILWSKVKRTLQASQEGMIQKLQAERDQMIEQIICFKNILEQMQISLITALDEMVSQTNSWISNLQQISQDEISLNSKNLLEELVRIGNLNQLKVSSEQQPITHSIDQCNHNFQFQLKCSFQKLLSVDFLPKLVEVLPTIFQQQKTIYINEGEQGQIESQLNQSLLQQLKNMQKSNKLIRQLLFTLLKQTEIEDFENIEPQRVKKVKQNVLEPLKYQLVAHAKQKEYCYAVAFNYLGTIIASGCKEKIKLWHIEKGRLKKTRLLLEGHPEQISCLVFSKKLNWLVSGSFDSTIRCWKETSKDNWISSQPTSNKTKSIMCLLLNKNDDQLISKGYENMLKIWKVDCNTNEVTYDYSLDKHESCINCISLNESESSLVSFDSDSQLIILGKGEFNKWEFKYYITHCIEHTGYRVSFMNDNFIALQLRCQGETHIFELENGVFKQKPQLLISTNETFNDYDELFPFIFNTNRKVLISKFSNYVYIIRQKCDGKFKVEMSIDCNSSRSSGALSGNGEHLVIWDDNIHLLRLYKINYD